MDIYLYQMIKAGLAATFNSALIQSTKTGSANILMHCVGGSVPEGIAMCNTIIREKEKGNNISTTVEGVAASMGAVLAAATGYVKARPSARFMIHEITIPQTGGNEQKMRANADLIASYNTQIAEIIAKKVNKTAEWVKTNWMKPNIDAWFSASEALAVGLVDEILTEDLSNEFTGLSNVANTEVIDLFNTFFDSINDKKSIKMDELKNLCNLAGVEVQDGMTEEVLTNMLGVKLTSLVNENNELKASARRNDLADIDRLMTAKNVPTKQRKFYVEVAERMGKGHVVALLEGMADTKVILEARVEWDYKKWQDEDPEGLLEIMECEPDRFQEIVKTYTQPSK